MKPATLDEARIFQAKRAEQLARRTELLAERSTLLHDLDALRTDYAVKRAEAAHKAEIARIEHDQTRASLASRLSDVNTELGTLK